MKVDSKILQEIERYKNINNYIFEQDAALPPPPAGDAPPAAPADPAAAGAPPADPAAAAPVAPPTPTGPQPVDLETDKEVEKIDDKGGSKKEVEVTDLVKSQKNIETKQEEYFENLFSQLSNLETKLADMDKLMTKLNSLEAKVEKYRIKSPEEKMELRTLDSGPYNQKLSDFFQEKESDFEKSGKEQYVLTKDDVEDYSPHDIKKSFRNFEGDNFTKL